MKRLIVALACSAAALVLAAAALAGAYAGPQQWVPGQGAGGSFGSSGVRNEFVTYGCCGDKLVTFIDNVRYGWHNTVRNRREATDTWKPYPGTYKPHCVAHDYFWGSCSLW